MIGALHFHFSRFGLRGSLAYLRSQVRPGPQLLPVRHPDAAHPILLRVGTSDIATYEQVFVEREYEFVSLGQPKVIVDAGANIGLAAVVFATRFPEARVIAIEPERNNFKMLERNLAPYPNAVAVHGALWDSESTIDLVDPGFGNWAFMTRANGGSETSNDGLAVNAQQMNRVRAFTVDTLMREQGLQNIDILKIDIEGAEFEVFADPSAWIGKVGAMIVELHERMKPGCEARFRAAVGGFPLYWTLGENHYVSQPNLIREA